MLRTQVAEVNGQRLLVTLVFVGRELDLKALATAAGGKRAALASSTDAERATGYVVGGISPLGEKRRLPTFVNSSGPGDGRVYVSAGRRARARARARAQSPGSTEIGGRSGGGNRALTEGRATTAGGARHRLDTVARDS